MHTSHHIGSMCTVAAAARNRISAQRTCHRLGIMHTCVTSCAACVVCRCIELVRSIISSLACINSGIVARGVLPANGLAATLIKYLRLMKGQERIVLESIVDDFLIHLLVALGYNDGRFVILYKEKHIYTHLHTRAHAHTSTNNPPAVCVATW